MIQGGTHRSTLVALALSVAVGCDGGGGGGLDTDTPPGTTGTPPGSTSDTLNTSGSSGASSDAESTGGGPGGSQAQVCRDLIECLNAVEPAAVPPLLALYGESGSCWELENEAEQQLCADACLDQLQTTIGTCLPETAACALPEGTNLCCNSAHDSVCDEDDVCAPGSDPGDCATTAVCEGKGEIYLDGELVDDCINVCSSLGFTAPSLACATNRPVAQSSINPLDSELASRTECLCEITDMAYDDRVETCVDEGAVPFFVDRSGQLALTCARANSHTAICDSELGFCSYE